MRDFETLTKSFNFSTLGSLHTSHYKMHDNDLTYSKNITSTTTLLLDSGYLIWLMEIIAIVRDNLNITS